MIVTGDQSQVDLPNHQKSGLSESVRILRNVKGIATVELTAKDVVRHKLVKQIIGAYDKSHNIDDQSKKKVENDTELQEAYKIREVVFIEEQECPVEEEFDGFDDDSTHFVAYQEGEPVGCCRYACNG